MKHEPNVIFETERWKVILADEQTFLGRAVVLLKRRCEDLAYLNGDEQCDFFLMLRLYENAVRKSFGASLFNWACLMDHAYRNNPAYPQVHWHVRPRYRMLVHFAGEIFVDEDFGSHHTLGRNRQVSDAVRNQIIEAIQGNLPRVVRWTQGREDD